MARHNKFVADYVHHLPQVSPDAPLEPGRLFHDVFYHDESYRIYGGHKAAHFRVGQHLEGNL
jgi:hypothetical protein